MTGERAEELRRGLEQVHGRMADAVHAAGRSHDELTLVVVTKFHPGSDVELLHALGVRDMGENRHQEAAAKVAELDAAVRADLTVHFIGQLQSNKAAAVAAYADVVQSVDRAKVARALDRGAASRERVLDVTVQVDLDGHDAGRGGAVGEDSLRLCDEVAGLERLRLRGLMAVAPLGAPPEPAFERLARLAERVRANHPEATWISAGMSGDLEAAVAHGATHLRVGTAILGSRPPQR